MQSINCPPSKERSRISVKNKEERTPLEVLPSTSTFCCCCSVAAAESDDESNMLRNAAYLSPSPADGAFDGAKPLSMEEGGGLGVPVGGLERFRKLSGTVRN